MTARAASREIDERERRATLTERTTWSTLSLSVEPQSTQQPSRLLTAARTRCQRPELHTRLCGFAARRRRSLTACWAACSGQRPRTGSSVNRC